MPAQRKVSKRLGPGVRHLALARCSFVPGFIRGHRLRFASLHLLSMCSTSSNGAARPPPDESLHSACRRSRHVKSGTRANAHCVEWWKAKAKAKAEAGVGVVGGVEAEEAELHGMCFKPEFNSVFHVGVSLQNNSVGSLSLGERARVRGLLIFCRGQKKTPDKPEVCRGLLDQAFRNARFSSAYWQASQSGSSMAQAFGTGAGPAGAARTESSPWLPPLETAFSLPVLMVDFSVLVAARARR